MDRWCGKVAVVTGSSVGIGAEIATRLADHGVIVVGLARRKELTKSLPTKGTIHAIQCDLTKEEEVVKAFQWVVDNLGGVDILINNAGVLKFSSLIDGNAQDWRDIMELNVLSLGVCSREALKSMKDKQEGHIVNLNSITGHHVPHLPELLCGAYSASKFAVTAMSEALRVELQKQSLNIKLTSISPGPVLTDMLQEISKHLVTVETMKEQASVLETSDVADAVMYALGTRPGVQVDELIIQPLGIFRG